MAERKPKGKEQEPPQVKTQERQSEETAPERETPEEHHQEDPPRRPKFGRYTGEDNDESEQLNQQPTQQPEPRRTGGDIREAPESGSGRGQAIPPGRNQQEAPPQGGKTNRD
jgi:hypothetical protein